MSSPRRNHGKTNPYYTRRDHYQDVTDRIITALEQGIVPWRRPWDRDKAGQNAMPHNVTTGRHYRGINILMLGMSPLSFTSGDNRWCSYKQASEQGWQVRKGEQGTTIFFFKQLELKDQDTPAPTDDDRRFVPMLRAYSVFHASQIEGIPAHVPAERREAEWRRPEAVDVILRNSGAIIRIGGAQAFYNPASDHIQLPPEDCFDSAESWQAVALHELSHWTGKSSRLDRDLTGNFGTPRYAEEELRAEISSAFMGARLNLPTDIPNHACYLRSWVAKLREDKRAIFRAAAAAQRIADYCLAFHPDHRANENDETETTQEENTETRQAA